MYKTVDHSHFAKDVFNEKVKYIKKKKTVYPFNVIYIKTFKSVEIVKLISKSFGIQVFGF